MITGFKLEHCSLLICFKNILSSFNDQVKESLNIEQDSFGANEVFPEAQAGDSFSEDLKAPLFVTKLQN